MIFQHTQDAAAPSGAQHGSRILAFSGADAAACACTAGVPKEDQAGALAHFFPEQSP